MIRFYLVVGLVASHRRGSCFWMIVRNACADISPNHVQISRDLVVPKDMDLELPVGELVACTQ